MLSFFSVLFKRNCRNYFHFPPPPEMGNSVTHRLSDAASGQVILSDGTVFKYEKPITVAELMLEHPQEVVVEFQPLMKGKKPTPLPADHKLELKKLYLMLPIRKGKPAALSTEEAQKLLARTNSFLKSKALLSYTGFVPLFVRLCPAGKENDAVLNKKKSCLMEGKDEKGGFMITNTEDYFGDVLEGRPEFLSRQISGKGWKPSLDTITEKTVKAKVRHWLLGKQLILNQD